MCLSYLLSLKKITLKQIYCRIVSFQFEIKRQEEHWGLLAGFFFCLSIEKKNNPLNIFPVHYPLHIFLIFMSKTTKKKKILQRGGSL